MLTAKGPGKETPGGGISAYAVREVPTTAEAPRSALNFSTALDMRQSQSVTVMGVTCDHLEKMVPSCDR